jgi:hypothetical protein
VFGICIVGMSGTNRDCERAGRYRCVHISFLHRVATSLFVIGCKWDQYGGWCCGTRIMAVAPSANVRALVNGLGEHAENFSPVLAMLASSNVKLSGSIIIDL